MATVLSRIRNAVVAADCAHFLWACQTFSEGARRAICLRNRHYVTGGARLRDVTKQLPIVPQGFAPLIDTVAGVHRATDRNQEGDDQFAHPGRQVGSRT